ncbi:hypothetical protein POPTR_002G256001v4 [Populus trichocarpa]|uniref:Uncharacterized protein n=4 Tax=Populus trichocarpa TaxID=3694 RepID=A0ACC0TG65_POPTR|nr:hypothetical protein BDE02_02G229700 [Populus trichocarpa]KAI9400502.1 hypothetical protein POPTR_002G256001v4 [Populus trichocarpa]
MQRREYRREGGGGIGGDQEMDYSLAALKLLRVQLKDTSETPSQNALTLGGILFQRAWLQGILVSNDGDGRLLLDDGTGVIELCLSGDFRLRHWDSGTYPFSFLIYFFFWHILAYIDRSVFLGCIFELYRDVCDGSWRVLCPSW